MTSRWESSTRPLVVRTVWVNGLRHAILTPATSAPLSTGPASTTRPPSATSGNAHVHRSQPTHELTHCLVRWKLVVGRGRTAVDDESAEADCDDRTERSSPDIGTPSLLGSYCQTFQPLSADPPTPSFVGPQQPSPERRGVDAHLNPLSERVLQWLDLAGRASAKGAETAHASYGITSTMTSTVCSQRKATTTTASSAPRRRKIYPVVASEVPAMLVDKRISRARRSNSSEGEDFSGLSARQPKAEPHPTPASPPPAPPPPLIQTFQHMTVSRHWSSSASQARPQLHIFVPAMQDKCRGIFDNALEMDLSDCESGISDI